LFIWLSQVALLTILAWALGKGALKCPLAFIIVGLGAVLLLGGAPCWAADSPESPPPKQAQAERKTASPSPSPEVVGQDGDFWTSPTMTGDWFGLRSKMEESGVTFGARVTQFGFGVEGGIDQPVPPPLEQGNTFAYTGRGEYELIFDLDKLLGLTKGRLLVRAENWWGKYGNVSLGTGALTPSVFPAFLPPRPNDPGMPFLTNFLLIQPLHKNLVIFLGKRDLVGAHDQDTFSGGDGTSQFMNQALVANPAFMLGPPYSTLTIGAVSPQDWGQAALFMYGAKDLTAEFFDFSNPFQEGFNLVGELKLNTHFFGLPGDQHLGLLYGHHPLNDLRFLGPPRGQYPEPTVPGAPTLPDFYTLYHGFDQYLFRWSEKPNRGWGLFGRASISDGNPTPLRYFVSAGIGGDSPFGGERRDTFGVGWYFNGATSAFGPFPRRLLDPQNGTGLEIYYNFQVTPWLNITPDIQYILPGIKLGDESFVFGLRVNTSL